MITQETETKDSGRYAFYAARDARMRSAVNATRYSDELKVRAERMKLALDLVYAHKSIHINFRKTKISVKVDRAVVVDRKNLRLLEQDWEAQGVTKTQSPQGVTYSFG